MKENTKKNTLTLSRHRSAASEAVSTYSNGMLTNVNLFCFYTLLEIDVKVMVLQLKYYLSYCSFYNHYSTSY